MSILNLGVVAHVDAGKTTLTERLLFAAGLIDEVGSVDDGSTQTDSLPLERQRGITIKSAVVSFAVAGVSVNLIDTPGHPDFIAEVERALRVLDGAVLVISAVEGVQAQTRVLFRTLRRLRVPTLLFVNKIDRRGARAASLLQDIAVKLQPEVVAMGSVAGLGTREAAFAPYDASDRDFLSRLVELCADDDALLAAYVHDEASVPYPRLRHKFADRVGRAMVCPVFFGSAITGAGVDQLMAGLAEMLPVAGGDPDGPASGIVFKVERDRVSGNVAYVRLFSGMVRVRERLPFGDGQEGKVTEIDVVEGGTDTRRAVLGAGEIGKLRGLDAARVGDAIGVPPPARGERHLFAPPTLETIIVPRSPADRRRLYIVLRQLAEQDPLISLQRDGVNGEMSISLYGEVQKEVIEATLSEDYGIDVEFKQTTVIYIEKPAGSGSACETLDSASNPFLATLEIRVEPAPAGTGAAVQLDVPVESVPIYVYKAVQHFRAALEDTAGKTLRQGLYGWQVTDYRIIVTRCGYKSPETTAADFRKLMPLVLMSALKQADTIVCEPIDRFQLDSPQEALGSVLAALAKFGAVCDPPQIQDASFTLTGLIPVARIRELERVLPALAHGEGVLETVFDHYRPALGPVPIRPRWDDNPLDREEYLLRIRGRVAAGLDRSPRS